MKSLISFMGAALVTRTLHWIQPTPLKANWSWDWNQAQKWPRLICELPKPLDCSREILGRESGLVFVFSHVRRWQKTTLSQLSQLLLLGWEKLTKNLNCICINQNKNQSSCYQQGRHMLQSRMLEQQVGNSCMHGETHHHCPRPHWLLSQSLCLPRWRHCTAGTGSPACSEMLGQTWNKVVNLF